MSGRAWADDLKDVPAPARLVVPEPKAAPPRTGLEFRREYEWIDYPAVAPMEKRVDEDTGEETETPATWWTPEFIGFRAKVLVKILGGEEEKESRLFYGWLRGEVNQEEYLGHIAPRVLAWDYVIVNEDGSRETVPAPAEKGWEAFYDLPGGGLMSWLVGRVRTAHLPKATAGARKTLATKSASGPDSPIPTQPAPEPEPPLSLSMPSDSSSTS